MIDSEQKLSAFLLALKTAGWVALDTEADSLHAYPEKLCLVQLSIEGSDVLLDPLSRMDYKPVLEVLQKQELIMHGADYDLRLLRRHFGFVPDAIFDTMLAGRLLGVRQFGLNDLVMKLLGVKLEKGPQKANWARRPLTPRMESYARNDTHYLKPLADILRAELEAEGAAEVAPGSLLSAHRGLRGVSPAEPGGGVAGEGESTTEPGRAGGVERTVALA